MASTQDHLTVSRDITPLNHSIGTNSSKKMYGHRHRRSLAISSDFQFLKTSSVPVQAPISSPLSDSFDSGASTPTKVTTDLPITSDATPVIMKMPLYMSSTKAVSPSSLRNSKAYRRNVMNSYVKGESNHLRTKSLSFHNGPLADETMIDLNEVIMMMPKPTKRSFHSGFNFDKINERHKRCDSAPEFHLSYVTNKPFSRSDDGFSDSDTTKIPEDDENEQDGNEEEEQHTENKLLSPIRHVTAGIPNATIVPGIINDSPFLTPKPSFSNFNSMSLTNSPNSSIISMNNNNNFKANTNTSVSTLNTLKINKQKERMGNYSKQLLFSSIPLSSSPTVSSTASNYPTKRPISPYLSTFISSNNINNNNTNSMDDTKGIHNKKAKNYHSFNFESKVYDILDAHTNDNEGTRTPSVTKDNVEQVVEQNLEEGNDNADELMLKNDTLMDSSWNSSHGHETETMSNDVNKIKVKKIINKLLRRLTLIPSNNNNNNNKKKKKK
ncbi:Hlr1p NDAI_0F04630 [Naumovozyma dairenensis CBS 421]|uniref:Uncharacterized protein n=1 Tax=Naumovozyma dairenensis (strain ATCC 10597 / BCRC 20456 / CBS 421 / NBRC 0211 / NRRL Y-12639) TaxID=1071378 RepID=G0WDC0_NAUDC|nr:hypothetical protein NDAI_0F04630 [Naumovozyma dairenensis CBS 421]CCD25781.1 hypothetical protein NDAI_0F04630 [Naumovozyma dairenensis CBS 421]